MDTKRTIQACSISESELSSVPLGLQLTGGQCLEGRKDCILGCAFVGHGLLGEEAYSKQLKFFVHNEARWLLLLDLVDPPARIGAEGAILPLTG